VRIMQRENVPERAARAGARLAEGLAATPGVDGVRGLGLLLAAELAPGLDSKAVAAACLDGGLVVNAVTPTALRFEPPLLVTDDEIDEALAILGKVLA
jgi:acetylornithine/N-succinyldiaminopimelate aminotransferase